MPEDAHSLAHDVVASALRRTRQRYTVGRRRLVETLLALDRPVTLGELVDEGADQSQSSLYRNLAVLEQCGVVRRLSSVDDVARYELDEHLTGHHHHVVCHRCGRIDDVVLPPDIERALADAADEAREQRHFEIDSHRVELVGTCPGCA